MDKKTNRSIFVVYEDEAAREDAVNFCDRLIERFWTKCHFDVDWVSFKELTDPQSAERATERAAVASAIVFATEPWGWLPAEVRHWTESWIAKRADREGLLIGLGDPATKGHDTSNKFTWVRSIARRAGLDYLTQAPEELAPIPDSQEFYSQRANTVTSVLDEILKYHPLPGQKQ
jgi:hypothetical protein